MLVLAPFLEGIPIPGGGLLAWRKTLQEKVAEQGQFIQVVLLSDVGRRFDGANVDATTGHLVDLDVLFARLVGARLEAAHRDVEQGNVTGLDGV